MVDSRPVEVWHGRRKVTVYDDVVIRVWGSCMADQMLEEPRTHDTVGAAFDWLYEVVAEETKG